MSSVEMSSGEGFGLAASRGGAAAGFAVAAGAGASWIETAKVSGPTWTRSRSLSLQDSVVSALPLTRVPLRLPRSRTMTVPRLEREFRVLAADLLAVRPAGGTSRRGRS